MLVAHHLRGLLEGAEQQGRLRGQVVLVPVANPIGLAQRVDHKAMGRFDLDSSENFNRHYPNLANAVFGEVRTALGPDAETNVATVRAAVRPCICTSGRPATRCRACARRLACLAFDADLVLDLHCDCEAELHLYSEECLLAPHRAAGTSARRACRAAGLRHRCLLVRRVFLGALVATGRQAGG